MDDKKHKEDFSRVTELLKKYMNKEDEITKSYLDPDASKQYNANGNLNKSMLEDLRLKNEELADKVTDSKDIIDKLRKEFAGSEIDITKNIEDDSILDIYGGADDSNLKECAKKQYIELIEIEKSIQVDIWKIYVKELASKIQKSGKSGGKFDFTIKDKSRLSELISLTIRIFESVGTDILRMVYNEDTLTRYEKIMRGLNNQNHLDKKEIQSINKVGKVNGSIHQIWMRNNSNWEIDLSNIALHCMVVIETVNYPTRRKVQTKGYDNIILNDLIELFTANLSEDCRIAKQYLEY